MKVLVLGGSGFIGQAIIRHLLVQGRWHVVSAARRPFQHPDVAHVPCDVRDVTSLTRALAGVDAVINSVAGDAASIADGARCLALACAAAGRPRVVHLSTMSVYGSAVGWVDEQHPLQADIGWYGQAKIAAERQLQAHADAGGELVLLRPGCVNGTRSPLWSLRIASLLKSRRLGDLGIGGDGWANLVDVEDVAQAAALSLDLPLQAGRQACFNLAAPDSPRWNRYFTDLAIALKATPVRRISARRLQADAYLLGPPLKLLERLVRKRQLQQAPLPQSMPPSLLRLWRQQIHLRSLAAEQQLGLSFTPYQVTVQRSASS